MVLDLRALRNSTKSKEVIDHNDGLRILVSSFILVIMYEDFSAEPKMCLCDESALSVSQGMLNPISRQEEVIRDVTALGDSLKKITTRSGQTAITQEIQSLQSQHQDTRRAIVQMEEHCEGLLNEILLSEKEFTRRVQRMKQDAGELEEELSVLSQTLSPIQENSSLDELAEHWRVNMVNSLSTLISPFKLRI